MMHQQKKTNQTHQQCCPILHLETSIGDLKRWLSRQHAELKLNCLTAESGRNGEVVTGGECEDRPEVVKVVEAICEAGACDIDKELRWHLDQLAGDLNDGGGGGAEDAGNSFKNFKSRKHTQHDSSLKQSSASSELVVVGDAGKEEGEVSDEQQEEERGGESVEASQFTRTPDLPRELAKHPAGTLESVKSNHLSKGTSSNVEKVTSKHLSKDRTEKIKSNHSAKDRSANVEKVKSKSTSKDNGASLDKIKSDPMYAHSDHLLDKVAFKNSASVSNDDDEKRSKTDKKKHKSHSKRDVAAVDRSSISKHKSHGKKARRSDSLYLDDLEAISSNDDIEENEGHSKTKRKKREKQNKSEKKKKKKHSLESTDTFSKDSAQSSQPRDAPSLAATNKKSCHLESGASKSDSKKTYCPKSHASENNSKNLCHLKSRETFSKNECHLESCGRKDDSKDQCHLESCGRENDSKNPCHRELCTVQNNSQNVTAEKSSTRNSCDAKSESPLKEEVSDSHTSFDLKEEVRDSDFEKVICADEQFSNNKLQSISQNPSNDSSASVDVVSHHDNSALNHEAISPALAASLAIPPPKSFPSGMDIIRTIPVALDPASRPHVISSHIPVTDSSSKDFCPLISSPQITQPGNGCDLDDGEIVEVSGSKSLKSQPSERGAGESRMEDEEAMDEAEERRHRLATRGRNLDDFTELLDNLEDFLEVPESDEDEKKAASPIESGGCTSSADEPPVSAPLILIPPEGVADSARAAAVDRDGPDDEAASIDLNVTSTDRLIVVGKVQYSGDMPSVEVYIYNPEHDKLFIHHDYYLSSYPLCVEWLDFNYEKPMETGSFVAIGTMQPEIEVWSLNVINALEPDFKLGIPRGFIKEGGERLFGHRDSVTSLSWNSSIRKGLASGSADCCVAVWDLTRLKCLSLLAHHRAAVTKVSWHTKHPQLLLTGSKDQSVTLCDCRTNASPLLWSISGAVEDLAWDPYTQHQVVVGTSTGTLCGLDVRAPGYYTFTCEEAHSGPISGIAFDEDVPSCLYTASEDGYLKLWEIGAKSKPFFYKSKNMNMGILTCVTSCAGQPFVCCVGGQTEAIRVVDFSRKAECQFVTGDECIITEPFE